jgi:hypothetical protein
MLVLLLSLASAVLLLLSTFCSVVAGFRKRLALELRTKASLQTDFFVCKRILSVDLIDAWSA